MNRHVKENPTVSIILPTYNRAHILGKCIDSVLSQTYENWDLVILDDHSTDNTSEVISNYVIQSNKITGDTHQQNVGLPKNRNAGIRWSKHTDLIFFIEDDIVLHPKCVEEMVKAYKTIDTGDLLEPIIVPRLIENTPQDKEAVGRNTPFYIDHCTGEIYSNYGYDTVRPLRVKMGHACCMYPREHLVAIGGYAEKAYKGTYCREESDLNMRLINNGVQFYYQPTAVADHNRITTGGCRLQGKLKQTYYYARNHIVYLLRNYGIKASYMIPCFVLVMSKRMIINNLT